MRRLVVAAPLAALMVLLPYQVEARPGDPRVVRGTLAWSAGAAEPFVVVRGDDGRHYLADLSAAELRGDGPVGVGERMSVVGVEGARPYEVAAAVVGAGDSALTQSPGRFAPPTVVEPSASPALTPTAPVTLPPAEREWRRIDGKVDSLLGATLRVRSDDGRIVPVDLSRLSARGADVLLPGQDVTVFAESDASGGLVAVGFIQVDRAAGSALPRQGR